MKKVIILAALAMTSLAGCDKVKDATSKDIKVDNVKFDFTAVTEGGASKSGAMIKTSEEMSTFTVTRTVELSELNSPEVTQFANKIIKATVSDSKVTATMTPSGEFFISYLTISAKDVTDSPLVIPSYTVGELFKPTAAMKSFTSALFMKLMKDQQVSVTVSGETNAPEGTTVTVSFENDMVFTINLL